ncbi:hypothetical protein LZ198_12055 [Myxococcus sp. K15C18031901]|uniref:hypothetical protein n=1 Tax=Myxococcus dinghuensis TaxID=2906761 RepID=UPI0020A80AFE|nr:hypothetical protein [Myxococcus dinghuensis]MCP3099601.1 hypothetical protein [Myxococcus dinghuensis]
MTRSNRSIFLGFLTAGLLTGCASRSGGTPGGTAEKGVSAPGAEAVHAPPASNERVSQQDVNGDGKPDVWTYIVVERGEDGQERYRKVRQELDLNWDGRVDLTRFFDPAGALTREVMDLDYDGKVDATYFYEKGANTRRERDFDGDGRADTTTFYEKGQLVRKERDTNGDGRVDSWEYWENGQLDRLGEDLDGDGTVDKWTRNPDAAREQ